MLGIAVASVIGIFLLLQASFRSWRLAVLAFLALPASVVGGLLAAFVSGGVISLGSIVGFLAVLGIAARDRLSLVHHYRHLEGDERMPSPRDLVPRRTGERPSPLPASAAAILPAPLPL